MANKLISILLNCHNGEKYLKETLRSIKAQDYNNWELVFIDNNSTDKTKNIFDIEKDKRFKYFFLKNKKKLGYARNYGLSKCKGDYIAFIDDDDLWEKDKLSQQITYFKDKKIDLIYTNVIKFSKKKKLNTLNTFKFLLLNYDQTKNLFNNYNITLSSVILRRSIIIKYNYKFNENFNYIEDFDFFIRISRKHKFKFIIETLTKWRVHDQSLTHQNFYDLANELLKFVSMTKIENPHFYRKYLNEFNFTESKAHLRFAQHYYRKHNLKKILYHLEPYKFVNKNIFMLLIFCKFPKIIQKKLINLFKIYQLDARNI
jgi:glycosyltransferase involved in cell wall biosynthesis